MSKRVGVGTVHLEWDDDAGRMVPKRSNGRVLIAPKGFAGTAWVKEGDGEGEVEVVENEHGPPSAETIKHD